jgi:hypothetical protein
MAARVIIMELLGRGAHANPRRGANVLEFASVLAGERWSSSPHAVHPAIAAVAGTVNDLLADDPRRLLTPIAPWVLGTNTADPRVWPAVANVCVRAALASISGRDQPRLLANLDITQKWLTEASSPSGGRRRGPWADRRDRRWARHAIGSALLSVAGPANQGDADAALCQVLVDCINACRQLAGAQAVDPRLPLADCPQRIVVEPRWMWSPGCDWMELGYRPVPQPLPGHTRATGTERRPSETQSTTAQTPRQARGMRERWAKRRKSAGNSAHL